MPTDIQPADRRLQRVTAIVLASAVLAAIILVFVFQHWLTVQASRVPTEQLIVQLRRGIGGATLAIGLCLLVLAGYAARLARRVIEERRWPLAATRVLRNTPIRRDTDAKKIAGWLNAAALALMLVAAATVVLSWRLFTAGP
ncbi:MAG: hypothetical protein ABI082_08750 [Dokdonella sp.]